jgi:hypothetical protein
MDGKSEGLFLRGLYLHQYPNFTSGTPFSSHNSLFRLSSDAEVSLLKEIASGHPYSTGVPEIRRNLKAILRT